MAEDEESSSGESTDACSEKFDPLKALYSDKVCVPMPDAPIYDNISKFESIVLNSCITKPSDGGVRQKKAGEGSVRRFLPHQEPIKSVSNRRQLMISGKNLITRMQKALGPLAMLYQYMENKTRVKVYTRNAHGLRGHVEAYVAAFDRHWNLALEDCLELWSRKVKRKAPALGTTNQVKSSTNLNNKIIVKKNNGKMETLERYVPQLLLRGEHVVLIIKLEI